MKPLIDVIPNCFAEKCGGSIVNDFILLGIIFVLLTVYGIYLGRNRLISFILSFYAATFLYNIFPFTEKLMFSTKGDWVVLNKILIFLMFFLPLNIIINKHLSASYESVSGKGVLKTSLFAIMALALILVFSYSVVNFDSYYNFSPTIDALFTESRIFWWQLAPLVFVTIF